MLLRDIVEVNEKGIVASSVNFGMMDDAQNNLNLCEGFIFNYNPKSPKESTVGILDTLRRSYHSRNEPNIHLMIQDYGKGKSHFAVAIANFFKKSYDSPEVEGILHQIDMATQGKQIGIAEGLRLYKQNHQHGHLVVCLSGDRGGDIRKHFLQSLLKSLDEVGIQNSLAQHICSEPLRYLESLSPEYRQRAEEYLKSIGNPDGDFNTLISLLKENNPAVITQVKNIAKEITGFIPDFAADIDVEAILKDILDQLCSGEHRRFDGILILFDELNYYLQSWAADAICAGGTALQNITNICERYKGKIALLSFTQIHPSNAAGIPVLVNADYKKLSSRLAPKDSTYNPESSLELVLDNLLLQKVNTSSWQDFFSRWNSTLLSEARTAFEQRIKIYKEKGWSLSQFNQHLAQGCFPLHPLTAYLLCNLDFTQDRTAIQFIKSYVKEFIATNSVERAGILNYIYPIALVDTFIENFANYPVYSFYKKAKDQVHNSEYPDELITIKALFLYYASGEKLTKSVKEDHEDILSSLTGISKSRIKSALDKLMKTRDLIYYKTETKLYHFFEGINPRVIEEEIEKEIIDNPPNLNNIIADINAKIARYLGNTSLPATQFVEDGKLVKEDWHFQYKVYSIDELLKVLSNPQSLKTITGRGILVYVLSETRKDLEDLRQNVEECLASSQIKCRVAIAIPKEATGDLAHVWLKIKTLDNKEITEKRLFGTACEQLLQRWQEQFDKQLENILKDCTYHCIKIDNIPLAERGEPQKIISNLLQGLYPFVPPIEGIDKMRSGHQTGSKITGFVAKQLLADTLTHQVLPDTAYKTVINQIFVTSWGLLKASSQKYTIQEPVHKKVRAAWDAIGEMTKLDDRPEKILGLQEIWQKLSEPPYGYSEYTFTVLLAGWLAYHQKEVTLKGADKLSFKKTEQASIITQSPKDWANSDIWEKPKDFVNQWIIKLNSKLIRRRQAKVPELPTPPMNYDQAVQYLQEAETFMESSDADAIEVNEVRKNRDELKVIIDRIEAWFKYVEEVETVTNPISLERAIEIYRQLLQEAYIDLKNDVISVHLSQQQQNRKTQALERLRQQIEILIDRENERAESLSTEAECETYKKEIGNYIKKLEEIINFPPHLIDILRNCLPLAEQVKEKIIKQAKNTQCLSDIKRLFSKLTKNATATQEEYRQILQEIQIKSQELTQNSPEMQEVQQMLETIKLHCQELNQKIEIWSQKASEAISKEQILEISNEIAKQSDRFTEVESKARLKTLKEKLQKELVGKGEVEDLRNNIKVKLQRIQDLNLSKMNVIFQVYQEIINLSFALGEERFIKIKLQAKKLISEKLSELCRYEIKKIDEYQQKKKLLETSLALVANNQDFSEDETSLNKAMQELEQQKERLSQNQTDQIITLFRQLSIDQKQSLYGELAKYLMEES